MADTKGASSSAFSKTAMDRTTWAMLVGLSILWGGSFIFMKIAARELPVFTIVWLRVGLAAAVLVVVAAASGRRFPRLGKVHGRYALMGLANNVIPFALIVYAIPRIGAGAASILNGLTPVFILILAHFFTNDEHMTARKLAGITLGLCGLVVFVGPKALAGLGAEVIAGLAMVGAAISYAVSGLIGRSFHGMDPVVSSASQLTYSTILLVPVVVVVDTPWRLAMPGLTVIAAILGLALVSTAAAYVVFFAIIRRAGATNVLLVTMLIPVSALFLAVAFLGERVSAAEIAGMALITAGLLTIDGRLLVVGNRVKWRNASG